MKETVTGSILLLFLSVVVSKELHLGDLPDEVLEHFKNFGLLNSLNIDKNSIEIVPAASRQSYGSQTSITERPPTSITALEGSTLPPNNSVVPSPAPYVEEVTINPPKNSYVNSQVSRNILEGQKLTQREVQAIEERSAPITITKTVPELVERPVYIRLIQPVQVPIPQPYPVEVRVPTPVYVRLPVSYPIGTQQSSGVTIGNIGRVPLGSFIYPVAPQQSSNGLLNSYVASRLGGLYKDSFNQYQTLITRNFGIDLLDLS